MVCVVVAELWLAPVRALHIGWTIAIMGAVPTCTIHPTNPPQMQTLVFAFFAFICALTVTNQ